MSKIQSMERQYNHVAGLISGGMKQEIQKALNNTIPADQWIRVLLTTVRKTPALLQCDLESLQASLMEAAQAGLRLDGFTGEAYLADWVIDYMFGAAGAGAEIRSDERIDWDEYLAGVDDSKGFFQDLED